MGCTLVESKTPRLAFLLILALSAWLAACGKHPSPLPTQPQPAQVTTPSQPTRQVQVTEYPPLDWSLNAQRIEATGCLGKLTEARAEGYSCQELLDLGCAEVQVPHFYAAALQPPYPFMECIHAQDKPADPVYFRQLNGLDPRYRSFAILQDGHYRLMIQKADFRETFAPVETPEEALSYAMALTGLGTRFDLQSLDGVEFMVNELSETHVEETPDGYLVYLFDWSHQMGCDIHPFYAVTVLVTPEGEVREIARVEIYRSNACFDFEALQLEE